MTARIRNFGGQTMRSLGVISYAGVAKKETIKIPQDIIGKEIFGMAKGKVSSVHAGTPPVIRPLGVLDGAIKRVEFSLTGSDKQKAYDRTRKPRHNNAQVFGNACPNLHQQNSATLSDPDAGTAVLTATSGQNTAFSEAVTLCMFENKLSSSYMNTLLDTRGLQTAALIIEFDNASAIQDPNDATAITSMACDFDIEIFVSCVDNYIDSALPGALWVEKSISEIYSAAVTRNKKPYYPEGEVQGCLFSFLKDSTKPVSVEEMSKILVEAEFDGVKVFEGSALQLAQFNNSKTMKHEIERGSFYWNFLHNSTYKTGLPTGSGKSAKPLEIYWTIPSGLGNLEIVMEYDLIIEPKVPEAPAK
jgi:hypothetical protein